MTENRNQLQKTAMHFGTYMGVYWILKFILFPLGLTIPILQFLFILLTIGVPFLGYYFVKSYRDKECKGSINFAHAWVYTVFMYLFASLLTAVAHYIYFQFIDNGHILGTYHAMILELKTTNVTEMGPIIIQLEEILKVIGALTPIEVTVQLLSQNLFYGSLIAIPTALIVRHKNKTITSAE